MLSSLRRHQQTQTPFCHVSTEFRKAKSGKPEHQTTKGEGIRSLYSSQITLGVLFKMENQRVDQFCASVFLCPGLCVAVRWS